MVSSNRCLTSVPMLNLAMFTFVLLVCATITSAYHVSEKDKNKHLSEDTLELVHVIFRHGDRTPDVSTIYPTDPYANETYHPYGKGQLTLRGMRNAYNLGGILRDRYDEFLGPEYVNNMVEARSSSYPRTRNTMSLVLANLFVPKEDNKISRNLLWQPVPFEYTNREVDDMIATFYSCDKVFDMIEDVQKTVQAQKAFEKNKRLYDYLSEHSGWNVNSTTRAFYIYNTLQTESEWGMELPNWVEKVWPAPLKRAAGEFWRFYGSSKEIRQIAIGNLLGKIVNDTIIKFTGDMPKERKMFLYAGHDFNIVPMMGALGNIVTDTPYTATVVFEVHRISGEFYIKALYNDYSKEGFRTLKIKGCNELCPFDTFQDLIQENIPAPNTWCK